MPAALRDELDLIGIPLVFGFNGLNFSPNTEADDLRDGVGLIDCTGVVNDYDSLRRAPSHDVFNTYAASLLSGSPEIYGVYDASPGSDWMLVHASDGRIARLFSSNTAPDVLASSLAANRQAIYVEAATTGGSRRILIFTGRDRVRVFNPVGATLGLLTTPPSDWSGSDDDVDHPVGAVQHRNAIWAFGNDNRPHDIYKSTNADHLNFTIGATALDGQQMPVYPGVGYGIFAAASILNRLYVWKRPTGVFVLNDADVNPANWYWEQRSASVGIVGPHPPALVNDDAMWVGLDGQIHRLSALSPSGDPFASVVMAPELGLELPRRIRRDLSGAQELITAIYSPESQTLSIIYYEIGQGTSTRRLYLDLRRPRQPVALWSSLATHRSMALRQDGKLAIGTTGSTVVLLPGTSYGSTQCDFTTRRVSLIRGGTQRGNLHRMDVFHKHESGVPFSATIQLILDDQITKEYVLGPEEAATDWHCTKVPLTGDAHRVQVKAICQNEDETMNIERIVLWVSPGTTRPR